MKAWFHAKFGRVNLDIDDGGLLRRRSRGGRRWGRSVEDMLHDLEFEDDVAVTKRVNSLDLNGVG